MDGEQRAAAVGDGGDEALQFVVGIPVIDADAVLDGDGHVGARAADHGLHAVAHQLGLGHEAGAEFSRLHAVAGAAAIEVDLVVAAFGAQGGAAFELAGVATAQLQGHRVFLGAEAEQVLLFAVHDGRRGDHFCIQPHVLRDEARQEPVMPVGAFHHGGDGNVFGDVHGSSRAAAGAMRRCPSSSYSRYGCVGARPGFPARGAPISLLIKKIYSVRLLVSRLKRSWAEAFESFVLTPRSSARCPARC